MRIRHFLSTAAMVALAAPAQASDVGATTTFQNDTPALASEVNANFQAIITAVNDNNARIAALESAGSASPDVAGHTYRFVELEVGHIYIPGSQVHESFFTTNTGTIAFGVSSVTVSGSAFGADLTVDGFTGEVGVSSLSESGNGSGTYTQSGNSVSFDDGEDIIVFHVSNDGSTLIAQKIDSATGETEEGDVNVIVGVRQ